MPLRLLGALGLVLLALVTATVLLPHSPAELRDLVVGAGVAAPLAALVAWVLLTPALFPGTVLAAAGGLAFGALPCGPWSAPLSANAHVSGAAILCLPATHSAQLRFPQINPGKPVVRQLYQRVPLRR